MVSSSCSGIISFGKLCEAEGFDLNCSDLSSLSSMLSTSESLLVMFQCGSFSGLLLFSAGGGSFGRWLGDGVTMLTEALPSVDMSGVAVTGIWTSMASSGSGDSDSLLRGVSARR